MLLIFKILTATYTIRNKIKAIKNIKLCREQ